MIADRDRLSDVGIVLQALIRALVDRPDEVEISEIEGRQATVIEVRVAPADHGKIVGRRGRTANAIRELLMDFGGKRNRRYMLEILD